MAIYPLQRSPFPELPRRKQQTASGKKTDGRTRAEAAVAADYKRGFLEQTFGDGEKWWEPVKVNASKEGHICVICLSAFTERAKERPVYLC